MERPPVTPPQDRPSKPVETTTALTGLAAFVLGAVGTIVAAISDLGSDDAAVAAARRNHVYPLLAAAVCGAIGLMLGGLFTLMRSQTEHANDKWKPRLRWAAPVALAIGIVAVASGVVLGAYATTHRQPGRPTIEIVRTDPSSIGVRVTSAGFPSRTWFEAVVEAYDDPETTDLKLATGRFSPDQDGRINWNVRVRVPRKIKGQKVEWVRVLVQRDRVVAASCQGEVQLTCLSIRFPETAEARVGASPRNSASQ